MKKNFPNWDFSTQHVQRPRGNILLSEWASRRWSRWRWGGDCKFSDPSAVYLHEPSQEMKELFGSVGGGMELVLAGDQVPRGRALSQWSLLIYLLVNKLTLNVFALSASCARENSRMFIVQRAFLRVLKHHVVLCGWSKLIAIPDVRRLSSSLWFKSPLVVQSHSCHMIKSARIMPLATLEWRMPGESVFRTRWFALCKGFFGNV